MFDVIEVSIKSGKVLGFMAENKTKRTAEKIEEMAVIRRGVKDSFYTVVETDKYKIGDKY